MLGTPKAGDESKHLLAIGIIHPCCMQFKCSLARWNFPILLNVLFV